jgi:nucleoside-diphosphate-sugar epimerase
MKILILGSSGTIGLSLVKFLKSKNLDVIEYDIKDNILNDLRIENVLENVLQDIDYVFFLAFDVGGSKYNIDNKEYIDNNLRIIYNTFNSLEKYKIPFLYTSSQMSNMIDSSYGVLKKLSEFYVNLLNGVNIRLWNIYGIEEINDKSHVIPDLISKALTNNIIDINSSGLEERQFIYSEDCAEGFYNIMMNHSIFKNKTIDFSNFQWINILNIAEIIKTILLNKYNIDVKITTNLNGKNNHSIINNPESSILENYWKPKITIEKGIEILIDYYIKQN